MTPAEAQEFFDHAFMSSPVMVILRGFDPDRSLSLARRAWSAGIAVVEVPLQSERDVRALEAIVASAPAGSRIGAGTITSAALVDRAKAAGASFTVAPGWDRAVQEHSLAAGLAHLPGVATPTEVQAALAAGTRWQKAFPASVLGAGWFSAMRGPFPDVRFVATGGVSERNARSLRDAGAAVVSLGSSFAELPPQDLVRLAQGM